MDVAEDPERTAEVIADLVALRGATCKACARRICAHEALVSRCLGFLAAPRCLECLARGLEREPQALRNEVYVYIQHQPCLRRGWEWADAEERACSLSRSALRSEPPAPVRAASESAPPVAHAHWDAGDLGCGELVLELRMRMSALAPGEVFALTATDPGALEDLPAWCRMTGHTLVALAPPRYWIRHK